MSESCEHCKHWTPLSAYQQLLGECEGIGEMPSTAIVEEIRGKAFTEVSEEYCVSTLITSYAFGCRMFRYKEEE